MDEGTSITCMGREVSWIVSVAHQQHVSRLDENVFTAVSVRWSAEALKRTSPIEA